MQTTIETKHYVPVSLKRWERPPSYWGATWDDYYIAPVTCNRDSDCLERSNWDAQWDVLKPLQKDVESDDTYSPIKVDENHWAVGWVSWVAIHKDNENALRAADKLSDRLENYPVLDEMDLSEKEMEEANEVWSNCYRERERIEYIRKHRSQFEFDSFSELLAVVRGKYFNGYASELIQ